METGLRKYPIYLVLDCSASMSGASIAAVRQGIKTLLADLQSDPQAIETMWLSVITFDSTAKQVVPLTPIHEFEEPVLQVANEAGRVMGNAIRLLQNCLSRDVRTPTIQSKGDFRALVFLVTCGPATDDWQDAAEELRDNHLCRVVACAAGSEADVSSLNRITDSVVSLADTSSGTLSSFFRYETMMLPTQNSNSVSGLGMPLADEGSSDITDPPYTRKLPVYVLIDCSASMSGASIAAVRQGIKTLLADLQSDPQALETVWISVITFDSDAKQVVPLTPIDQFNAPTIDASGTTSLGAALKLLLDCVDKEVRKTTPDRKGDFAPIILCVLGSAPTDNWIPLMKPLLKLLTDLKGDIRLLALPSARLGDSDDVFSDCAENVDVSDSSFMSTCFNDINSHRFRDESWGGLCSTPDHQSVARFLSLRRTLRAEAILDAFNPANDPYFSQLFCWPTDIVVRPMPGVLTPRYAPDFFFDSGRFKGKEKEGRWFCSPKLRSMLSADQLGTWVNYLQICLLIAQAVRRMHAAGLAHCDLSPHHILVDPPGRRCVIIGFDCVTIPGRYDADVLGTPGYIAPEVLMSMDMKIGDPKKALPSIRTDLHAIAVLFYEYLLRRHPLKGPKFNITKAEANLPNVDQLDESRSMGERAVFIENPTDTSTHWSNNKNWPKLEPTYDRLGPPLQAMFNKAFVDGLHNPAARPSALEWESVFVETLDHVVPCSNVDCPEKWFVYIDGERPKCPWCGTVVPHKLPIFDFYFAPRSGQFRSEGRFLVGWNQRTIHEWHVYQNRRFNEQSNNDILANVVFHNGQWLMGNVKLDSLSSASGRPVPQGRYRVLGDGDEILLSEEAGGKKAVVRFTA